MTRHLGPPAMLVLTVLLCGQVVRLTLENRSLQNQLTEGLAPEGLSDRALAVGDFLDPMLLTDGVSGPVLTSFVGQSSLVLFYSEGCSACQQTLPIWNELVSGLDGPRDVKILGIDIEGNGGGATAEPSFAVFALDPKDRRSVSEQIPVVPTAVFVREDGIVDRVWFGVPGQDDVDMMSALLQSGRPG